MSRGQKYHGPCPLCGRVTRAHSRLVVADVETGASASCSTTFKTIICRDCAFAMVVRSEAMALRGAM